MSTMLTDEALREMCTCGHDRGKHGMATGEGTCLHLTRGAWCGCGAFSLMPAPEPAVVPEPLGAVPTAAEIDLEAARHYNHEVVRLLKLAARGRREYAKGMIGSDVARTLEGEAEAYDAAAKIAAGLDQADVMKGLLPTHMWGEIDG